MSQKYVLGPNAARAVRQLIHGTGSVGSRQANGPAVVADLDYLPPFTVKWAASAGEEGSWIIWLPGSNLVCVDGNWGNPAADLEAAGGSYPEGWYLLDNDMLDPDDGGTLRLIAYDDGFEFSSDDDDDTSGAYSVEICSASVNSETGERKVRQFVTSAIVITGVFDAPFRYSRTIGSDGSPVHTIKNCKFYWEGTLKSLEDYTLADADDTSVYLIGTLPPATDSEPDPEWEWTIDDTEGEAETGGRVLNFLMWHFSGGKPDFDYRTTFLTLVDPVKREVQAYLSPFCIVSGETEGSYVVTNCCFYWEGELQTLSDHDVDISSSGSIFLSGTQSEPTEAIPNPIWEWSVGESEVEPPDGGKALNFRLWDFSEGKPYLDYRTTFLSLEDTTGKAKLEIKKPDGDPAVTLDASGSGAKVTVTDGNGHTVELNAVDGTKITITNNNSGKSITLDTADIPDDCDGLSIHAIKYTDSEGQEQTLCHGLLCKDATLPESGTSVPSFTFVSDVTWNGSQIVISKKQWNGTAIVNATGSTIATTPIS